MIAKEISSIDRKDQEAAQKAIQSLLNETKKIALSQDAATYFSKHAIQTAKRNKLDKNWNEVVVLAGQNLAEFVARIESCQTDEQVLDSDFALEMLKLKKLCGILPFC